MNKLTLCFFLLISNIFASDFSTSDEAFFADTVNEEKSVSSLVFLVKPAKIKFETRLNSESLVNLIDEYRRRALDGEFLSLGINTGFIEMDVKGDKARLTFFNSSLGELKKAMKVKISPSNGGRVEVEARIPYCHIKELYKKESDENGDISRWKFSKNVEEEILSVLEL